MEDSDEKCSTPSTLEEKLPPVRRSESKDYFSVPSADLNPAAPRRDLLSRRSGSGLLGETDYGEARPIRKLSKLAVSTGSIMFDNEGNAINVSGQFRPSSPSDDKLSEPSSMIRRKSSDALRMSRSSSSSISMQAAAAAAVEAVEMSDESRRRCDLLRSAKVPKLNKPLDIPLVCCKWDWTARLDVFRHLGWKVSDYIDASSVDEQAVEEAVNGDGSPEITKVPMAIAQAKAKFLMTALSQRSNLPFSQCLIITSDQRVCDRNRRTIGRASSRAQAQDLLMSYSSSSVTTITSLVVTHYPSGISVDGTDKALIHFQNLPRSIVAQSVDESKTVLDCAGALIIEDPLVLRLVERIEGTIDSVFGLPVQLLCKLMTRLESEVGEAGPRWDAVSRDRAESKDSSTGGFSSATTTTESLGLGSKDAK